MKLEAAHRLISATDDTKQKLRKFVASLSAGQREYFFFDLPIDLADGWFGGDFKKNLKTDKIVLEGSAEILAASFGREDFQRFIIGMLHLRSIFVPTLAQKHHKIYRLTSVKEKPKGKIITFSNKEQYRSLTSWTLLPDPVIEMREKSRGVQDVILCYDIPNSKNVLFDYLSVFELLTDMRYEEDFYSGTYIRVGKDADARYRLFRNTWNAARFHTKYLLTKEQEVALYLNAGQEIECTWRPA